MGIYFFGVDIWKKNNNVKFVLENKKQNAKVYSKNKYEYLISFPHESIYYYVKLNTQKPFLSVVGKKFLIKSSALIIAKKNSLQYVQIGNLKLLGNTEYEFVCTENHSKFNSSSFKKLKLIVK